MQSCYTEELLSPVLPPNVLLCTRKSSFTTSSLQVLTATAREELPGGRRGSGWWACRGELTVTECNHDTGHSSYFVSASPIITHPRVWLQPRCLKGSKWSNDGHRSRITINTILRMYATNIGEDRLMTGSGEMMDMKGAGEVHSRIRVPKSCWLLRSMKYSRDSVSACNFI